MCHPYPYYMRPCWKQVACRSLLFKILLTAWGQKTKSHRRTRRCAVLAHLGLCKKSNKKKDCGGNTTHMPLQSNILRSPLFVTLKVTLLQKNTTIEPVVISTDYDTKSVLKFKKRFERCWADSWTTLIGNCVHTLIRYVCDWLKWSTLQKHVVKRYQWRSSPSAYTDTHAGAFESRRLSDTLPCAFKHVLIIVANHRHIWWACEHKGQSEVFTNLLNSAQSITFLKFQKYWPWYQVGTFDNTNTT